MSSKKKIGIVIVVAVLAITFMTVAFLTTQTNTDYYTQIAYQKCFNPHCIATKKRVPRALVQASLLFVKYLT